MARTERYASLQIVQRAVLILWKKQFTNGPRWPLIWIVYTWQKFLWRVIKIIILFFTIHCLFFLRSFGSYKALLSRFNPKYILGLSFLPLILLITCDCTLQITSTNKLFLKVADNIFLNSNFWNVLFLCFRVSSVEIITVMSA